MGFFALRFFARGIGGLATFALLLCVLFPSSMGVNAAGFTSDPNVRAFITAVVNNLPDLGKSIQGSLAPSQSGGIDPSQYLDVQNTFQNIASNLKGSSGTP